MILGEVTGSLISNVAVRKCAHYASYSWLQEGSAIIFMCPTVLVWNTSFYAF